MGIQKYRIPMGGQEYSKVPNFGNTKLRTLILDKSLNNIALSDTKTSSQNNKVKFNLIVPFNRWIKNLAI